jgi:hypothetical protein
MLQKSPSLFFEEHIPYRTGSAQAGDAPSKKQIAQMAGRRMAFPSEPYGMADDPLLF